MSWIIRELPEVERDMRRLDSSQRRLVAKLLLRVRENPLPASEGGYGKPLGHKAGVDLTGLLKVKLKDVGLRVVYTLIRTETVMLVIVVGVREDEEVCSEAQARLEKHDL